MLVDTVSRPPRASTDDTDWDLFAACAKSARGDAERQHRARHALGPRHLRRLVR